ncbi:hypothetical protein CAL14_19755 [Bordetella genomosp. 9]|uniref:glycosyltransferase family 2 protein n=1 Tax=Bordetella genomosp. 9 TaxID=1416803 RepID=UPI000A28E0BD|nr:glycosyltransferase [Bordetella genomosp. 9]ARP92244.1 hypothetical protein CAL14_19755 [Bordetella genomosp. 9]
MPLHRDFKRAGLAQQLVPLGALQRSLRRFGGLGQVTRRAVGIVHREGWKGVCRGAAAMWAAVRSEGIDGRNDYEKWVAKYDSLGKHERVALLSQLESIPVRPLVSVIMPVYNPQPRWLEAAIESVRMQLYPEWELCIADDASTDPSVRAILSRYARSDPRIKVTYREKNGHISACSNTALSMAQGEWVVLFDHDDLLAEHALFWLVHTVNSRPGVQLVYSDEDKITESGVRCVPHFKPDWNYELFLAYNVVCHLAAYRRSLITGVGGFREGMEGAQDYDLALRCVERLEPAQIVHVPRVLYHWRMHATSTAMGGQAKPYALPAGERALNEHFFRCGVLAKSQLQPAGYYRTRYTLPSQGRRATLIVTGAPFSGQVKPWLNRLLCCTKYDDYEVLILSDRRHPVDVSLRKPNILDEAVNPRGVTVSLLEIDDGFATVSQVDKAVSTASGDFIVVLQFGFDPLSGDWLTELLSYAAKPGVGAVSPRLIDSTGKQTGGGVIFGLSNGLGVLHGGLPQADSGYFHRAAIAQNLTAVSGGCLVMRKSRYQAAGGLDVAGIAPEIAEVDLCLRLGRAGFRTIYVGHVVLRHSAEIAGTPQSTCQPNGGLARTIACAPPEVTSRWLPILEADPAYNANLTLEYEDFSLAWPPRVPAIGSGTDAHRARAAPFIASNGQRRS